MLLEAALSSLDYSVRWILKLIWTNFLCHCCVAIPYPLSRKSNQLQLQLQQYTEILEPDIHLFPVGGVRGEKIRQAIMSSHRTARKHSDSLGKLKGKKIIFALDCES